MLGGLLLAVGTALILFVSSQWALLITLGVMTAAGAGAGSFSILIGATARQLPPEKCAFAGGFINAAAASVSLYSHLSTRRSSMPSVGSSLW